MIEQDDWRLRGQEEYLNNMTFIWSKYYPVSASNIHAHCEFCWHKFMENSEGVKDCSQEGYKSMEDDYWVCKDCFEDFQKMFNWKTI